jgi:hypothetical protein
VPCIPLEAVVGARLQSGGVRGVSYGWTGTLICDDSPLSRWLAAALQAPRHPLPPHVCAANADPPAGLLRASVAVDLADGAALSVYLADAPTAAVAVPTAAASVLLYAATPATLSFAVRCVTTPSFLLACQCRCLCLCVYVYIGAGPCLRLSCVSPRRVHARGR